MIYIPPKQPRAACVCGVTALGSGAVLYFLGEFLRPRAMFQLSSLILITIAIFLAAKFLLCDYKYVINAPETENRGCTFVIVKISGKRENVMASFDLGDVYAFEKCKKISAFEKAHGKVNKAYNYVSNFMSNDVYSIAINFNGEKILFLVELSEKFANETKQRIPDTDEN
jgi:hypothetical protein